MVEYGGEKFNMVKCRSKADSVASDIILKSSYTGFTSYTIFKNITLRSVTSLCTVKYLSASA